MSSDKNANMIQNNIETIITQRSVCPKHENLHAVFEFRKQTAYQYDVRTTTCDIKPDPGIYYFWSNNSYSFVRDYNTVIEIPIQHTRFTTAIIDGLILKFKRSYLRVDQHAQCEALSVAFDRHRNSSNKCIAAFIDSIGCNTTFTRYYMM